MPRELNDRATRQGQLAPAAPSKKRGPPFCRCSRPRIVYAIASLDKWAREREYRSTKEYVAAA
jgi:hypothetical protein